ncbi:twin transmembrane helix small protein [Maritimibacter sp. 55A14]|uniref:twin transmembrane helix small protein n=1 Tax=Maritimibacter sp. 55A14 TaxID=2174844 RepID=UPI000D611333|nr:twin transmembrane helix small protein [Maritimibacter sp. 55A14]PWE32513.1 twin transmembrane helix small protein [Maritimibacter sp. 55A14]
MANDPLFYVVAGAVLLVLVILMIGIGGFAKGGDFNRKHANRLMRYRIIAQAVAIVLIIGFVLIRRMGG